MQLATHTMPVASNARTRWSAYLMIALPVLLLVFSGVTKVLKPAPVAESFIQLGYPDSLALTIGMLELACVAIYLIPRTSVLGAILLTGYLGGAIATHVRVGSDLFSILLPIIIGALIWGSLFLRDARLRALIPLRT